MKRTRKPHIRVQIYISSELAGRVQATVDNGEQYRSVSHLFAVATERLIQREGAADAEHQS